MDLTLFHPKHPHKANLKGIDRRNSRESYIACHIYEWTGYYNLSIRYRLLGHYRLYQLFKKSNGDYITDMPVARAYILQYQATHGTKYFLVRFTAWVNILFGFGYKDHNVEIQTINRQLLHEGSYILQQFLIDSEKDFSAALHTAEAQIQDPRFPYAHLQPPAPQVFVEVNQEHLHHINYSNNELHIHPEIKQPPPQTNQGKEKNVFSKKQLLILFDLLGETGKVDRIDWERQRRYEAIAELMHAITGKPKSSWQEELKDYRTRNLYEFTTDGERQEIINTLTNLAGKFRMAGFRKIADLADKKMREIERHML